MRLKFTQREYQEKAIRSVVDLFEGLELQHNKFDLSKSKQHSNKTRNELQLPKEKVLENLNNVQRLNNRDEAPIKISSELDELDFTIEMETGTGKTFVYLKTIMELNKKYGWKKYLIIVPSVAIREGVISEFNRIKGDFEHDYKQPVFAYVYDSKKLDELESYNRSSFLEIMVMTMQAFNKDKNVLNQEVLDKQYEKPMNLISELQPIVILDEPQKMGGEATKSKLNEFNALFSLRYSATHNEINNLIYRYTPFDAYQDNYVKKIEVMSIYGNDFKDINAYIEVTDIGYDKNDTLFAKIKFYQRRKSDIKLISRKIKNTGYDLFENSNRMVEYKGYVVTEINPSEKYIKIQTLKDELLIKEQNISQDKEELMQIQIKETIREHFEKEIRFNNLVTRQELKNPIKVLSLFFIDKVVNFRGENGNKGKIAKWFENAYKELTAEERYKEFRVEDINSLYKGYFAIDQVKNNIEIYKDTIRENNEDREAFKLIMQDKERLLSLEEPVKFIFSHSALREGWDNPNVFQICTLNETIKETRKRQEIGRGLRLAVDIIGDRIQDPTVNILTVIANESYDTFARSLQEEISEETGIRINRTTTHDGRKKIPVKLNKQSLENEDFKELWKRVSKITKYNINISTEAIIEKVVKKIEEIHFEIKPRTFKVQKNLIDGLTTEEDLKYKVTHDREISSQSYIRIPNVVKRISDLTGLTKKTIIKIITTSNIQKDIFNNPEQFINRVSSIINSVLPELLVDGIKYEPIGKYYSSALFKDEILVYKGFGNTVDDLNNNRTLYPSLTLDSENEVRLIKQFDSNHAKIKFYLKLPNWFKVSTPAGSYNPDWAIVTTTNDKDTLYFVRESKKTNSEYFNPDELRIEERIKIEYGKKHFDSIEVDYQVIESIDDLIEGVYPFGESKIPKDFLLDLKDKKEKNYDFDIILDFYKEKIKEYNITKEFYNNL